jgi:hypothetical protein
LKIDVEGAEYDIVLGDGGLLGLDIQCLAVEVDRFPRDERYEFPSMIAALQARFRTVAVRKPRSSFPLLICR